MYAEHGICGVYWLSNGKLIVVSVSGFGRGRSVTVFYYFDYYDHQGDK